MTARDRAVMTGDRAPMRNKKLTAGRGLSRPTSELLMTARDLAVMRNDIPPMRSPLLSMMIERVTTGRALPRLTS
jgi:hypothetical protein